jgi:asparagine synthase (glutamine-hydrolysing)
VSQVAAANVKVALTGLGGDELFGGYRRHLGVRFGDFYGRMPKLLREGLLDPVIRRLPEPKSSSDWIDHLKRFSRAASGSPASRYQDSLCSLPRAGRAALYRPEVLAQMNLELTEGAVTGRFDAFQHGGSVDRALKTDLEVYLPDDILTLTDRLSMWHSLELRVPFLDRQLVELAMRVPAELKIRGTRQKHLLKEVAAKYLPESVINHRKQGFEAPMGRWLRGPLRDMLEATLNRTQIEAEGVFRYETVDRLKNEHLSGTAKHSKILFSLLMFHLWSRRSTEAAAPGIAGTEPGAHVQGL